MGSHPAARRLFFRYAARETLVWFEELCGKGHARLSDIPKLSEKAFAELIPQVCPGVEILPEEQQVCARLPGAKVAVRLFSAEEANLAVFNRFNGRNSVGRIADELCPAMAWTPETSMARVRTMFLRLIDLRVCVPCNSTLSGENEAIRQPGE